MIDQASGRLVDVTYQMMWFDPRPPEWHRARIDRLLRLASRQNDVASRLRFLTKALEATQPLSRFDSGSEGTKGCLARTHLALGLAQVEAGLTAEPHDHLTLAARLFRELEGLVVAGPDEPRSLFLTQEALGRLELQAGYLSEARARLEEAFGLVKEWDIGDGEAWRAVRQAHLAMDLARICLLRNDSRSATTYAKEAIDAGRRRIAVEADDAAPFAELATSHWLQADADRQAGRVRFSGHARRLAAILMRRAADLDPSRIEYLERLADEQEKLAIEEWRAFLTASAADLLTDAVDARRKALALRPEGAGQRLALARALLVLGEVRERLGEWPAARGHAIEAQRHLHSAAEAGALPGLAEAIAEEERHLTEMARPDSRAYAALRKEVDAPASWRLGAPPERFFPKEESDPPGYQAVQRRRFEAGQRRAYEQKELWHERKALLEASRELESSLECERARRSEPGRGPGEADELEWERSSRLVDLELRLEDLEDDLAANQARLDLSESCLIEFLAGAVEVERPYRDELLRQLDGRAAPRRWPS
jgi:hypothetical protein